MKFFMHFLVLVSISFNSIVFADVSNTNVYKLILWPQHGIKIASGGSTTPPDTGGPVITEPNPWPESTTITTSLTSPDTNYSAGDYVNLSWNVTGADYILFSSDSYGTFEVPATGDQSFINNYLDTLWGGFPGMQAYSNPESFSITGYDLTNNEQKSSSLSFEVAGGQSDLFHIESNNLFISADKLTETVNITNLNSSYLNTIYLYADNISMKCSDRTIDIPSLSIVDYYADYDNNGMDSDFVWLELAPMETYALQFSLDLAELPTTEDCFYSFILFSEIDTGSDYLEQGKTMRITAVQNGRTIEDAPVDDSDQLPDSGGSGTSGDLDIVVSDLGAPPKLGSKSYTITNNESFPVDIEIESWGATDSHNWRTWSNIDALACFYDRDYKVNGSTQSFNPIGLQAFTGSIPANSTMTIESTGTWKSSDHNPDDWMNRNPDDSWLGSLWEDTHGGLPSSFKSNPFQTCATDFFISLSATNSTDSREWSASNYVSSAYDFTVESSAVGSGNPNLTFYQPTTYAHNFSGNGQRHELTGGVSEIGADWSQNRTAYVGLDIPGDSWSCEIYSDQSHPLVRLPFDISNTRSSGTLNVNASITNKSNSLMSVTGYSSSYSVSAGNYTSGVLIIDIDKDAEFLDDPSNQYSFNFELSGDFYKEGVTNKLKGVINLNMGSGKGTECHASYTSTSG